MSQPENRLTSCWNDVDALHRAFAQRFGRFDRSWILTDRPQPSASASASASALPTGGAVRAMWGEILEWTRRHVETGVDLVLVYSGHGTFRLTTDPGELGGQSDALILLDQLLYDYDVMAQFVRPLGNHVQLLIVFDSCNSGSGANLPWTFNTLSQTVNQTSLHTDLNNNVAMIAGCRDEQTSAAGATAGDLSECTRVLIETLKQSPKPLLLTKLIQMMRAKLVAARDTQIPQLSLSKPTLVGATI